MADANAPATKGGLMGVLIPVVVLTVLAAGGGGLIGTQIVAAARRAAAPEAGKLATAAPTPESPTSLRELQPVVTNLAGADKDSWIRLQAAIVYDKVDAPQIEVLSAKVGNDILAVMRTLTIADLQGASGLELLREDLNERASIRSDGHIKELIIEMLVVQ